MVEINGNTLSIEDVVRIARQDASIKPLSREVLNRMQRSRNWVAKTVNAGETVIYGVNTGFGPLTTKTIQAEETRWLSRNVILNCACGVGKPLSSEMVRAMMAIRVNTLTKGYSGVRPILVQTLIEMLNEGVIPLVPSKGSLGASGDLAPLAHIAVVLTRDPEPRGDDFSGQAWFQGKLLSGAEAMARAGISRLVLEAKEGLALTNGTNMMVAAGAFGVHDGYGLIRHAEIGAALSLEALLGMSAAFHPSLQQVNNQPGQIQTAGILRALVSGSQLIDSDPARVQDSYSLRCTPQVIGPARDLLAFLENRFTNAINAATDNPLIFPEGIDKAMAISGGNFHGQGPAMWLDFLGIALAEIGAIAERRIFRMLTPELNAGLPSMLAPNSGLDSGLMIPQYTAAALVSDNKTLAHPDSVDSIPSSGNQEDHVSMGANAARHALEILENVRHILAIEYLTAAQAIDLRPDGPAKLGRGTAKVHQMIRDHVTPIYQDRALAEDIETLAAVIHSREILGVIEPIIAEAG